MEMEHAVIEQLGAKFTDTTNRQINAKACFGRWGRDTESLFPFLGINRRPGGPPR
jgi:hypothetical protein